MALRSGGRKLSFDILSESTSLEEDNNGDEALFHRSNSDPIHNTHWDQPTAALAADARKLARKKRKQRKKTRAIESSIPENPIAENGFDFDAERCGLSNGFELRSVGYGVSTVVCEENGSAVTEVTMALSEPPAFQSALRGGELRQRNVSCGGAGDGGAEEASSRVSGDGKGESDGGVELNSARKQSVEANGSGSVVVTKLENAESLDWKKLTAEDPNYVFTPENSPMKYFVDDLFSGHSLRSTTPPGNDKEREIVYDTIFRLPWRCELLINVGFFVCFDSFLSLVTLMPARMVMSSWKLLKTRQFQRPSPAELSDFGCFVIMACGVTLLERTDISLIYHMIRGQGTIKLYVVYNVLEIFDKLCQNFNGDVLQTLFNSAEGLANSTPETRNLWIWRYACDQALAVSASIIHSFILLAQAITLSTCIIAHNNALLALLVSNNFSEIKSNVFKRFSKDNIHSMVYYDSVERFHISAYILFVLAQNIREAEGPWFQNFLYNAFLVYVCEMAIDIIKHSFIAKFNGIKPIVYSEYLEDLCKQTLNTQSDNTKTVLSFIPLAPACVVIRVLTPVYAAHLPSHPLPWKLFWMILLFFMTYIMLSSLKILIGMGLKKHATWYINRCRKRKLHSD